MVAGLIAVGGIGLTGARASASSRSIGVGGADLVVSVPAGPLAISMDANEVILRRQPGNGSTTRYQGQIPGMQVADTRGTHIGWSAVVVLYPVTPLDTRSTRVFIHPDTVVALPGDVAGVHAARPEWTRFGAQVPLFSADLGCGGGTFSDAAEVTIIVAHSSAATVTLAVGASIF